MDGERFDVLTRSWTTLRSRRRALRGLAGTIVGGMLGSAVIGEAGAKPCKKKCGECKKCKDGACKPKPGGTKCGTCRECKNGKCVKKDGGSCGVCRSCQDGFCGPKADGASCGGGQTCRNGECCPEGQGCGGLCCPANQVCDEDRQQCANPGACATVTELACVNPDISCNGRANCACLKDVDDTTRCGAFVEPGGCNVCMDNDDCATLTGNANAFCVESGSNACCGPGQRFCRVPCPD